MIIVLWLELFFGLMIGFIIGFASAKLIFKKLKLRKSIKKDKLNEELKEIDI